MSPIGVGTSRSTQGKTNTPKLWLLLVGVNQYQDKQIPPLHYSAVDCQGLAEALIDASAGQSQKEVKIYHDFAPQLPLLQTVSASLKEITTAAKQIDTVLFYFSGHGIIQPNTQQAFLCLADTQKSNLENTGLALQDLLQSLSHCAAQNQLVWLDACHSGGMTLRGIIEQLPSPTPQLVKVLQQRAAISKGFYALLSCDTNQQSWEFPELGHGVFTYYLMRGLQGDAVDTNNVISADSLYRYVYHQTLQYIDKTNQQLRLINQQKHSKGETQLTNEYSLQTPKRIVEGVGELVLGRKLDKTAASRHHRVGLVIEGLSTSKTTLDISKFLGNAGGFELEYLPATKATVLEVRNSITRHLNSPSETILLYLRGRIEDTEAWEGLVFGEDIRIKRSWLKQQLRHSNAKQIIILDCSVETRNFASLQEWVEDLQIDSQQGQCIISCISTALQPERFATTLLDILTAASQSNGISAAYAIAQLQFSLAGSNIPFQVSLSGSQGIIEVLPPKTDLQGQEQSQGLDLHICPYMGLNAFSESDCQYYYGRESLTQELIYSLQNNSFLAVVGASGSGKSSVVQAGLIPQLRLGKQIPNSKQWLVKTIRPGSRPIDSLAQIGGGSKGEPSTPFTPSPLPFTPLSLLEGILHQGVEGFVYWLRSQPYPMIVLVVDQFEELFTLASDVDREKFLELALGAVKYASDRFKLIITLRADFIAACLEVPALAQALQQSSVLVSPKLSLDDYRQVITKPAHQVGLKVESELVEVLLRELDISVGNLPLLEFVLEQLWQHRVNGELTLQAYQQQLGGIQGALERSSQALYESLEPKLQDCAKWIFLALTQLGEGTEDTRRRVFKSELIVKKYPQELVDRTLQVLTNAKLIVVNVEETEIAKEPSSKGIEQNQGVMNHKGHEGKRVVERFCVSAENSQLTPLLPNPYSLLPHSVTVEVAHEILIRHWSTLRWWLEENRERLRKIRQIEQATQNWLHDEQADFLLQGVRLAEAEDIYIKYTDELSLDVQRYIEACLVERKRRQFQEKKRLRQAQRAVVGLSILGIAACSFGGLAYWQGREAKLREIEALNSSSQANLLLNQQLEALIVAVKAGKQLQSTFFAPTNFKTNTVKTLTQVIDTIQENNRLEQHRGAVFSISFSPDGNTIASASLDGTIILWGKDGSFQKISAHDSGVFSVSFSPDGKTIVSGGADQTVKLWNVSTRKLLATMTGHTEEVYSVAFSPNGKTIATGSKDKTIKLWHSDGKLLKTFLGHEAGVVRISFSPDGNALASASEDKTVKLWRISDGSATTMKGHYDWVNSANFSPDGKTIISAAADGIINLWHRDGKLIKTLKKAHGGSITSVTFSPDGQTFVSGSRDKTIKVWTSDGTELQTIPAHNADVESVRFSPDGKTLATASRDSTIKLWHLHKSNLLTTLTGHSAGVFATSFSPDGKTIVSASADNTLKLYSLSKLQNNAFPKAIAGHTEGVYSVSFSPNGKLIVSASADKTVKLWKVDTNNNVSLLRTLSGHSGEVNYVAFSPDGAIIASASDDKTIKIWKTSDGTLIQTLTGHTAGVFNVSFNPTGQILASAGADQIVKVWQLSDGQLLKNLTGHNDSVMGVSFSPDGNTIATASIDSHIKIWRSRDGQLLQDLTGHKAEIMSVTYSHNGNIIASGGADGTIKLWRSQDGLLLTSIKAHNSQIGNVTFSFDDKIIATASTDGTVKLWRYNDKQLQNLDLDNLLVRSCRWLNDYLKTNPKVIAEERRLCG